MGGAHAQAVLQGADLVVQLDPRLVEQLPGHNPAMRKIQCVRITILIFIQK